ncbi:MAG: protein kinase, partial [Myxococcales bacterium]|nr:protein kinase [Myxococcales bacterium]
MARSEPEIDVEVAEHPTPSTGLGPARGNVGRYRLTHELASGGMASVYLAFPELARSPGEAVAVKRVHPHLAVQRSFVEMFLDEARVAARIDHPNVARVLDIGAAEGGQFIAMELLLGRSLGAVAKRLKRLPLETRWPLAAHVVARAAEGLHAAHELRDPDGAPLEVVHRDVSPHNVFVTYDGRVKVVDFGIARARGRLHQTETGTVKGKFAYMAPEQMMGLPVDRRADVWALGVVLHELLVGDKLFKRSNDTETVLAVTAHRGLDPTRLPDGLPEALVDALRGALAPEPEARTPNAGALAEALDALGGLCHAAGALREAAQTLRRGLLTWVELRARDRAAITSSALGAVLLDLGESQPALTHLEEALEVQREAGDRQGELETLCALIELAVRQGSYARSLALSVRARELAEEDGRAAARSRALVADATVQRALGDMPAAERLAQRALRYAARGRDTGLELRARLLVGEALARRGDYEGARRHLQRVRRAAQSVGDRANERGALLELAGVELAQHRGGHARALLDSRPVPRPGRMQPWLGKGPEGVGVLRARERLLRCRIELAREKGSLHTAIRCAEEALHEAQQATLRDLEWRARYALAATYELRREDERALGLVVEAQEIVEELMAAVPPQRVADFLAVDPTRAAALRGDSPVSALHVKMGNVSDEGLRELRAMLSLRMPTIEPARTRGPRIVEGSSASGRPLPAGTTASEFARFVSLCRDLIDEAHVERVYERLVRVAVELSEAERGFLAVFGEDADSFTAHATHGFSELGRPRDRFARRCAFRAAERGQLVLSADVKVPAPVRERACLLGIGLRSVVAAPIKLPDGKRGVLFVDHA